MVIHDQARAALPWLKQVVIRAIDQKDTRRCLPQSLGGREAAKASARDDDTGNAIIHGFPGLSIRAVP
jgi:hypothetical protein